MYIILNIVKYPQNLQAFLNLYPQKFIALFKLEVGKFRVDCFGIVS